MMFVLASIASVSMTVFGLQTKPGDINLPQEASKKALAAELRTHADALLAKEGLRLSDEDRSALHRRINSAVEYSRSSPEGQALVRRRVDEAVRRIITATQNPELATLALQTNELLKPQGLSAAAAGAGAAAKSASAAASARPRFRCFSTKRFEQLTAQASKVVATVPDASRLNIVLTALIANANERRAETKPSASEETCVEQTAVDALTKELDALLSGPGATQTPPAGGSRPSAVSSLSAASAAPASQPAAKASTARSARLAPKGIVSAILALCPYPFCP